MKLVIHETVDAVLARESFDNIVLVFPDALDEVTGDPDVERAVPLAREDVDRGLAYWRVILCVDLSFPRSSVIPAKAGIQRI